MLKPLRRTTVVPTLDYQSKPQASSHRRQRIGSMSLTVACTLAAPNVSLAFGSFVLNVVQRHWMSGYEFNECLDVGMACNGIGLVAAVLAIRFGRPTGGSLMLLLNVFSLLLAPSLGYG